MQSILQLEEAVSGEDGVFRTGPIRARNDHAVSDFERAEEVLRRHRTFGGTGSLVDDIDPAVAHSLRFGLQARLVRRMARDDSMEELDKLGVRRKNLGSNRLVRFQWARQYTHDRLWGEALLHRDLGREESNVVPAPVGGIHPANIDRRFHLKRSRPVSPAHLLGFSVCRRMNVSTASSNGPMVSPGFAYEISRSLPASSNHRMLL